MKKQLVINLFGEPDSGKSRTAAHLFSILKDKGYKVELVAEYAKDLFYEGSEKANFQPLVFAEQAWRMERLKDKVAVVITDSPLLLSMIYNKKEYTLDAFDWLVLDTFGEYKNFNIFLTRKHEYSQIGRWHNEEEAQVVRGQIQSLMTKYGIKIDFTIGSDLEGEEVLWAAIESFIEKES